MKPATTLWLKAESKGRPEFTLTSHGTVRDLTMELAKWILRVHMGSHIRVTMARTEVELTAHSSGSTISEVSGDMLADLAAMLDQDTLGLDGED